MGPPSPRDRPAMARLMAPNTGPMAAVMVIAFSCGGEPRGGGGAMDYSVAAAWGLWWQSPGRAAGQCTRTRRPLTRSRPSRHAQVGSTGSYFLAVVFLAADSSAAAAAPVGRPVIKQLGGRALHGEVEALLRHESDEVSERSRRR